MPMTEYKARRDACRPKVLDKYDILGFISSGTYGRVYKAKSRNQDDNREFAIKKFKPDREGETHQYTGISQSAAREIARFYDIQCPIISIAKIIPSRLFDNQLCRELHHGNIIGLEEVLLEEKAIYMVFEYAEHDFL
ncbi:hypothetical protein BC936DRAFT_142960, partial [Jimgerdemannia flammicorona]